jgi:tRNA A37 threonylcarbamoyladenosine dehydratase
MTIIDNDSIDPTNINRQLPALSDTIYKAKTEVLASRLRAINPSIRIRTRLIMVSDENIDRIIDDEEDEACFIADAIDDLPAKVAIATAAIKRGLRLISSMGAGFRLDPSLLLISDVSRTHTCPLAKRFRRGLKDAGVTKGVPVVWSREKPRYSDTGFGLMGDALGGEGSSGADAPRNGFPGRAREPASMVFVPAAAGLLMASYIVRRIAIPDITEDIDHE